MKYASMIALLLLLAPSVSGAQQPAALDPKHDGIPELERVNKLLAAPPTIVEVPQGFKATWKAPGLRDGGRSCGSLKDDYGNARDYCAPPVDKLEPYMNSRMRAWIAFFDEPISPVWHCVESGLQSRLLSGVYLWDFSGGANTLVQRFDTSNWTRQIYLDGRPHLPVTETEFHGHSIGRVISSTEVVVDTTNFTFDPDGWDDHAHLPTSTRRRLIERYRLTSPTTMEVQLTVDDPIFLKAPFTWSYQFTKVPQAVTPGFTCDLESAHEYLYQTTKQKYADDQEFEKWKNK